MKRSINQQSPYQSITPYPSTDQSTETFPSNKWNTPWVHQSTIPISINQSITPNPSTDQLTEALPSVKKKKTHSINKPHISQSITPHPSPNQSTETLPSVTFFVLMTHSTDQQALINQSHPTLLNDQSSDTLQLNHRSKVWLWMVPLTLPMIPTKVHPLVCSMIVKLTTLLVQ